MSHRPVALTEQGNAILAAAIGTDVEITAVHTKTLAQTILARLSPSNARALAADLAAAADDAEAEAQFLADEALA